MSELQTGTPNKKTEFLFYDPFGRAHTIRPADGSTHEVEVNYFGTRLVERKVHVATSLGSEELATTTETYGRQGRLWKVQEPSGTAGAQVGTTYSYDVGNRLHQVSTSANGTTQNRSFSYDNRGFLTSETHPEKGVAGNGTVTYSNYDARGHAGHKVDGPNDLTFQYDSAERLLRIDQNGAPPRAVKVFTYGGGIINNDRSNGKLKTAARFNYYTSPITATVEVDETYTYGGLQGRVSQRNTQMVFSGTPRESFVQSWVYNTLGNVSHIDYPTCTFAENCPTTFPRGVNFTYTNGMLTSIPGFVSSISYHPNLQYDQIVHANGVTDTQANDPNAMPRPASLSALRSGFATNLWSSGAYSYDGAGNVTRTGNGYYVYDKVSRLVDGHIYDSALGTGNLRSQTYTYDPFGNLTAIGGDPWAPGRATPVNPATNRSNGTGVVYDAAGDQVEGEAPPSVTCATGKPCYEFDSLGMMTRMRNGGEDWSYVYTANDERFWAFRSAGSAAGPGSAMTLRDLDGRILREYSPLPTAPRDYIYRDGQLVASEGKDMTFTDVPPNHLYAAEIEALKSGAITNGCAAGQYCPGSNVSRSQMAVFLLRSKQGGDYQPPPCTGVFADVPVGFQFCDFIEELYRRGITSGCAANPLRFCPAAAVTSIQMAVFLLRTKEGAAYSPPPCVPGQTTFSDVSSSTQFCNYVEEVNRRGIDNGCAPGSFCPSAPVTRGRMAPLLVRTFSLPFPEKGYTKHYSLDHLGSPRLIASTDGSVIAYHAYFPFGEELTPIGQDLEQMKFTGHERDLANPVSAADDLDYMHARYYKPLIGRFLSPDRVGGSRQRPQTWNRYVYASNNPILRVDRNGLVDNRTTEEKAILESPRVLAAVGEMIVKSGVRESGLRREAGTIVTKLADGSFSTLKVGTGPSSGGEMALPLIEKGKVSGSTFDGVEALHVHPGTGAAFFRNHDVARSDSGRGSAADQAWANESKAPNLILNSTESLLRVDPGGNPAQPGLMMDGKDYQEYLQRADQAFQLQQQQQQQSLSPPPP